MAGALDMYPLRYYSDLYKKQHIPIHYVLVVGYDEEQAYGILKDVES